MPKRKRGTGARTEASAEERVAAVDSEAPGAGAAAGDAEQSETDREQAAGIETAQAEMAALGEPVAGNGQPKPDILSKSTRELPVTLTDAELATVARQLADVIEEAEQEEADQAEQKAAMKEALAGLKARQRKLASTLRRRIEYRPVEVHTLADYAAGLAREVRIDTGEVLSSRGLTDRERQPLLLPEVAAAADGAMAVHADTAEAKAT
jgi:hypothetical protein